MQAHRSAHEFICDEQSAELQEVRLELKQLSAWFSSAASRSASSRGVKRKAENANASSRGDEKRKEAASPPALATTSAIAASPTVAATAWRPRLSPRPPD